MRRRPLLALLAAFALLPALAPRAHAHGANLVVSRDTTAQSRLYVNGPSDYLVQGVPVELLKGDDIFTGYWFTDSPGIMTLQEDGLVRERLRLRPGHRLALKLLRADPGLQLLEPSTLKVVLARPGDTYEFVRDARGDFGIQMVVRTDRLGAFRGRFQFVDRAGLHAASAPFELHFEALGDSASAARAAAASAGATVAPDGHIHGGAPLVMPTSYREAVEALRVRLHDATMWIAARQYSRAVDDALAMRTLSESIRALALRDGSGVPPNAQPLVQSSATTAVAAAVQLHTATDLSDPIGARERSEQLRAQLDVMETYVPGVFACSMRCEGDKTYPVAGKCPVCGMTLMDKRAHQDHEPRHGGVFMMSPDFKHHLEAALGPRGLVVVYIYDEYTKSMRVDGIRGRIEPAGARGKAIALVPTAENELFTATLPASVRRPVRIALTLDFGDGSGEQTYDVEFARESK